jgi:CHAT domain-containing protein/tetratricopeptide (TPR) repeat protein
MWVSVLPFIISIHDARPGAAQAAYDYTWKLFLRGQLVEAQKEANYGEEQFETSAPDWVAKLRSLEAQILLRRGTPLQAFQVLSAAAGSTPDDLIQKLTLESITLNRLQRPADAEQRLQQAESLCTARNSEACGSVLRARGVVDIDEDQLEAGKRALLQALSFARAHHDQFLEATTLLNLSWAALQNDLFDEAVDWSINAQRKALDLGAEDVAQAAAGNLGWAYFELGDHVRALELFLDAQRRAARLGDSRSRLKWLENIGYVYASEGNTTDATAAYLQALQLAKRNDNRDDIAITLEYLAFVSIDSGKLEDADSYLDQLSPLIRSASDHWNELWADLARGRLAALRRQDSQARALLRTVQQDPDSATSIKLEAGRQLALLEEAEGQATEADQTYQSTLATFEQARNQLKREDSRLPFLANATAIYDDYIHFLIEQDKPLQALAAADQSRARTLEEGLDPTATKRSPQPVRFDPRRIAKTTNSTLLFYRLGEKRSYLWSITPAKIAMFPLPSREQIAARIESYREALLDLRDPLESSNSDGQALYQMLVAPASAMIQPHKQVIFLNDGILSKLNFETLLVPGPSPISGHTPDSSAQLHYLIDDLTLSSAPSLAMLAAAKPASGAQQRLLLIGNPVSPDRDFPTLPMFSSEMANIKSHFASDQLSVVAGPNATPAAYTAGQPERYSYLHFVSHAVANSSAPLDSAIILSKATGQEGGYKLYAREIIQHPIGAKLVTISACYGSGTRAYAGEGLVGLSWAFLRAGAHKVIGALWEVSDDSTPRLMDKLYQGLVSGESPAVALHNAKLSLLHSKTRFRIPFYWAPFQLYGRQ